MEIINIDDDDELYGDGGCWRRGSLLGEGSFGKVFMATSKPKSAKCSSSNYVPEIPSVMAVKSAEISCAETLRLERSVMSRLSGCSSVIQCFGAEITRKSNGTGVYNLLLELGSGGTLHDRIQNTRSKGLPESEVRCYTRSIVEGLVGIHEAGFVHCDMKPENILLCPINQSGEDKFQAKICDFGLAKEAKEDRQRRRADRSVHGTPWYLSPEAVKEAVQEKPNDIWSLGIIVLEMLTGRPAWDLEQGSGCEDEKVIRQILKASCIPKLPAGLSPEAKSFLQSCLRRMAKNRGTAKWLLRHPFISGVRVGPRSRPQTAAMDTTRSCVQASQLNADLIPKIRFHFA